MEKKYKTPTIFDLDFFLKKAADSAKQWLRSPREGERYSIFRIKIGYTVGRVDEKLIKLVFFDFHCLVLVFLPCVQIFRFILMVWRQ